MDTPTAVSTAYGHQRFPIRHTPSYDPFVLHWLALAALADPAEPVVWRLSVDGVAVGTRQVRVRYDDQVRIIEETTSLGTWVQQITANTHPGEPASFHSRVESDGRPTEVQARVADGVWTVNVSADAKTRTSSLQGARVDLSTVDLIDPLADRRLSDLDHARILAADIGQVVEGRVVDLGRSQVKVDGQLVDVDGYEWQAPDARWRFWYATNGFLVRYEAPLQGRTVIGEIDGPAPRSIDEFPIPPLPVVEKIDL